MASILASNLFQIEAEDMLNLLDRDYQQYMASILASNLFNIQAKTW
jgi:hypothetical protein